jgi:hypothetical protein
VKNCSKFKRNAFTFNLYRYRWEADVRAAGRQCKQRPYRAAATDVQGRSVLLPRYVAPVALPPGFRGAAADEPTLRQLLRFVHLVPHVTDMASFKTPAGMDIWTTNHEFLDMCAGDSEEHALLLCGFLLQLGVEVGLYKSDKQSAAAILDTSLTSQAYKSSCCPIA